MASDDSLEAGGCISSDGCRISEAPCLCRLSGCLLAEADLCLDCRLPPLGLPHLLLDEVGVPPPWPFSTPEVDNITGEQNT